MSEFAESEPEQQRDKLLASLFAPKESSKPKGPLIQALHHEDEDVIELDEGGATDISSVRNKEVKVKAPPASQEDEGPTMMEQIMAAQAEALRAKKIAKEVEEKKAAKTFGNGFKAGFFGSKGHQADQGTKPKKADEAIPTIRANKKAAAESKAASLKKVNEEVQKNLSESEHETIKELKKGEWMTSDLLKIFQSNAIISEGLRDPECTEAMELMQRDPKKAQSKFAQNAKVDRFLREFGRVMGSHFDDLHQQKQQQEGNNNNNNSSSSSKADIKKSGSEEPKKPIIQEVTSAARKGKKKNAGLSFSFGPEGLGSAGTKKSASTKKSTKTGAEGLQSSSTSEFGPLADMSLKDHSTRSRSFTPQEDAMYAQKSQEILKNEEMVRLIQDHDIQRMMMDCNDPVKLQGFMRDPAKRAQLNKLVDAGLLSWEK